MTINTLVHLVFEDSFLGFGPGVIQGYSFVEFYRFGNKHSNKTKLVFVFYFIHSIAVQFTLIARRLLVNRGPALQVGNSELGRLNW